ncbi:hypothetical protein PspLS_01210, partial [Pyricularia sp. CBS 133598]
MREKRRTTSPTWKQSWDMPNRHYVQPSTCEQGSPRRSGKDRHRRQGAVSLRVSLGRRTVYPLSAREKGKVINRLIGIRKFDAETTRGTTRRGQ